MDCNTIYETIEKIYAKENAPKNARLVIYPAKAHYFDKKLVFDNLLDMRKN